MVEISLQERKMYSEVYSLLKLFGNNFIEKIPKEIFERIEKARLETYCPKYNMETSFGKQLISRDALTIIAFFHVSYWCENDEEKKKILNIIQENENNSFNSIFQSNNSNSYNKEIEEKDNVALIEIEEKNVIKKIFKNIRSFISKIFKKN